ncbi:MAG: hypothetical protein L3J37_00210 [Rhodobacteraceae bacterium]|nr:hypothetical protein [Paracoccaceae bacterium]
MAQDLAGLSGVGKVCDFGLHLAPPEKSVGGMYKLNNMRGATLKLNEMNITMIRQYCADCEL